MRYINNFAFLLFLKASNALLGLLGLALLLITPLTYPSICLKSKEEVIERTLSTNKNRLEKVINLIEVFWK